ncbi:hypothetical protein L204_104375 [Cryptococcus depauperatus]|nr:hypothetical protein L204_04794 [Cryptococcus depauperatus CBS 7855]
MFPELPEHLQTLNSITGISPPSTMNAEEEEAFWGFLHADELFRNFGSAPSPDEHLRGKEKQIVQPAQSDPVLTSMAGTPASNAGNEGKPVTIESFLAAYMGQQPTTNHHTSAQTISDYLMPLPIPYVASSARSGAPTPMGSSTLDASSTSASKFDESAGDDKPSGAKKLKQIGANHIEIEEDKRRRNTEASARFRAKKKEREQALERRAKELEAQVTQLTTENSSLENENRLLKTIVLNSSKSILSSATVDRGVHESLQAVLMASRKRKREE